LYIPKINLPVEGVEHARWLEKRAVEQLAFNEEVRRFMARADKSVSAGARQTTIVNNKTQTGGSGLPAGGVTSSVVRKISPAEGAAAWSFERQGLLPEYWVTLDPDGASYYVTGLGDGSAADRAATKPLLPPVTFSDGGKTLNPINVGGFEGWTSGVEAVGPFHLFVELHPSVDGEEFTVSLPQFSSYPVTVAPFYTFNLVNATGFEAVVNIEGTRLYYAGTNVAVNGDDGVWTLPGMYQGAWHVLQAQNWGTACVPLNSGDSDRNTSDVWFDDNVRFLSHCFTFPYSGSLTTSTGALRFYNDKAAAVAVGRIRASVGTAPTGAAITVDVVLHYDESTTEVLETVTIPAGEHTAVTASGIEYSMVNPGEWLTVDVTAVGSTVAGSNLTVQVWVG
jgi:hypothetical protein